MDTTKVCSKCGEDKVLSEYGDRKGKCRAPGEKHAECKDCTNLHRTQRYKDEPAFREKVSAVGKKAYAKLRAEVLAAYGGKCACCGEAEPQFLSVDHVDNTGAAHRRKIGEGAKTLCNFLKREGYPDGFELLCFNCNCAKGFFGICPHKHLTSNSNI